MTLFPRTSCAVSQIFLVLLPACESTDSSNAFDRAESRGAYDNDLQANRKQSALMNRGGITPLAGWQVGSGTNGVQPFSNPGALMAIPQSH